MESPSAIPINRVNLLYFIDVDRIRIDRTRDVGSIDPDPVYDAHKADHEALLADMRYTMDAYEAGARESRDTTLDQCLTSWFHKHFRAQDTRLETPRP